MYFPSEMAARARSSLAVHAPCPPLPCHLTSNIFFNYLNSPMIFQPNCGIQDIHLSRQKKKTKHTDEMKPQITKLK
jgi:hypothetical protein